MIDPIEAYRNGYKDGINAARDKVVALSEVSDRGWYALDDAIAALDAMEVNP